jgi:hypothetical protein
MEREAAGRGGYVKLDIKRSGPRKVTKITFAAEKHTEQDVTFLHELATCIERECLHGGPSKAAWALARAWRKQVDEDCECGEYGELTYEDEDDDDE